MKQKYIDTINLVKSLYLKYKNDKKAIAIIGSIVLLLIVSIGFSFFLSNSISSEQKEQIKKSFYNSENQYTGPRIRSTGEILTNDIPSEKILALLLKKDEELSLFEKKKIEQELNDSFYFLTKEQAKGITITTVIVDPQYPNIEEWKSRLIEHNPYEQFVFVNQNTTQAKELLSQTENKYISTPIFIYGEKNPNIQVEKGKKYFFPPQENQYVIHTVTVNSELIKTFEELCPSISLLGDNKTIDFLAIGKKGVSRFIDLYSDIKLTGNSVCYIPEEDRDHYLDNNFLDSQEKILLLEDLYSKNKQEDKIDSNLLSEKNKELVNKIKLINAVLKNKSEFYFLDRDEQKLYMLDKITFK